MIYCNCWFWSTPRRCNSRLLLFLLNFSSTRDLVELISSYKACRDPIISRLSVSSYLSVDFSLRCVWNKFVVSHEERFLSRFYRFNNHTWLLRQCLIIFDSIIFPCSFFSSFCAMPTSPACSILFVSKVVKVSKTHVYIPNEWFNIKSSRFWLIRVYLLKLALALAWPKISFFLFIFSTSVVLGNI